MTDIRTVPFNLDRAARWFPDEDAFVQGFAGDDRRYTFADARAAATDAAAALADLGVTHGDRVALLNGSTVEHALVHFGCTSMGAVPAGCHTREAPATLAEMLARIDPTLVLFAPEYAAKVDRVREALGDTESALETDPDFVALDGVDTPETVGAVPEGYDGFSAAVDGAGAPPETDPEPEDTAYINFSSGTTSVPKPLVTTHDQITEMLHIEAGGTTEDARILDAFGTGFMGWENVALTNVATAATTVFHDGDVAAIAELAERERLTRISLVTSTWRLLLRSGELDEHDLSTVESAGVSGEPITPSLYEELRAAVTENVGTGYGLTETMGSGTSLPASRVDADTIHSVGKPGLTCDVRVIEPDSRDPEATVPDGETGEVIVAGPSVCSEVYDDPETTAELFHEDGWVFTGDRGHVEDGFLYLEGRADNMIVSGGINVQAERVERVIEDHPEVAEAGVVGTPHETWGEAVKAYIVPRDESLTADDLETFATGRDDLADHKRPREYEFVAELPRNNPGKLDRAALAAREREDGETEDA